MSKLSERVKKAKQLRITQTNGHFNTWGTDDQLYRVKLSSEDKEIVTPDGYMSVKLFKTDCQQVVCTYGKWDATLCNCKGNTQHTVCYHAMGCIWKSFEDVGSQVSFCSTFQDANTLSAFGGWLAKIENNNGNGSVWCVVRKETGSKEMWKINLLPMSERPNVILMRGTEAEAEGID